MKTVQTDVIQHCVQQYLMSRRTENVRQTMLRALWRASCAYGGRPAKLTQEEQEFIGPTGKGYIETWAEGIQVHEFFCTMTADLFEQIISKLAKAEMNNGKPYSLRTQALSVSAMRGVIMKAERATDEAGNHILDLREFTRIMSKNGIDTPKAPKDKSKRRWLDEWEVRNLLQACLDDDTLFGLRDMAVLQFMLGTGPRCQEVVNLQLKDYEGRSGWLLIQDSKGDKSREVQLHNGIKDHVDSYLQKRGKKSGAFFPKIWATKNGYTLKYEPMTNHGIRQMIHKRAEEAGVEPFSPHTTRRTAAQRMHEAGMSLQDIAVIMGHDSIETTAGYLKDDVRKALKALAKVTLPI